MSKYELTMGRDDLDLKAEQQKTLDRPRMHSNFILKTMYWSMDLIYGKARTLEKFKIIELLARYPYWAWEKGGFRMVTANYSRAGHAFQNKSDEALHLTELGRHSRDNERWHLMLIDDIMRQKNINYGWLRGAFLPECMAFGYLLLAMLMYAVRPAWSFAMNARFEDHAEHEYMNLVAEHPEWEDEPVSSYYFKFYPKCETMANLFRRIGLDERDHMHESLTEFERITGKPLKTHKDIPSPF